MHSEDSFHLGVKALIHNLEGRLLLLQSKPKKFKKEGGSYWDIPGGRIQKNESLEEALKREVYEETGLQNITLVSPFKMALSNIRIPTQNGDVGLIFATYLCEVIGDSSIQLSDEHIDFGWFDPYKAIELLAANYPAELVDKFAELHREPVEKKVTGSNCCSTAQALSGGR